MSYLPYIIISLLAIFLGQVVAHLNKKLPPLVADEIRLQRVFNFL